MEVKYTASKGYYDVKWDIVVDDCGRITITQTHNDKGNLIDEPTPMIDKLGIPEFVWMAFASAALSATVVSK